MTARRKQSRAIAARADARRAELVLLLGLSATLVSAFAIGLDLILRLIGP